MQPYDGNSLGHLSIQPGDVIEVVGSTDCGLLEGYVRGVNRSGFFPEHCVQEVNIRQKNIINVSTAPSTEYRTNSVAAQQQKHMMSDQQNMMQQFSSATAPRVKKRLVVIHCILNKIKLYDFFFFLNRILVVYRIHVQ